MSRRDSRGMMPRDIPQRDQDKLWIWLTLCISKTGRNLSVCSEYLSKMWKLDCNLVAFRLPAEPRRSYRVLIEPLSNVLVLSQAPNVIIYKLLHRALFFSR